MKKQVRKSPVNEKIIGKTISGVIARPGENGEVIMLQFDDGTCFELISSGSRKALQTYARQSPQLSFFPMDGDGSSARVCPSLAA